MCKPNPAAPKAEPATTASPSQIPKSEARRQRDAGDWIHGLSATATTKLSRQRMKAVNKNAPLWMSGFGGWRGDGLADLPDHPDQRRIFVHCFHSRSRHLCRRGRAESVDPIAGIALAPGFALWNLR